MKKKITRTFYCRQCHKPSEHILAYSEIYPHYPKDEWAVCISCVPENNKQKIYDLIKLLETHIFCN